MLQKTSFEVIICFAQNDCFGVRKVKDFVSEFEQPPLNLLT